MNSNLIELSHSEETERAVLAAMLLRPEIFGQICGPLRREHFYLQTHRILWDAFERLIKIEGEEVNLRTLQAALEAVGRFDTIGGVAYLARLDLDLPDVGDRAIQGYVRILLDRYARRRMSLLGHELTRGAADGGAPTRDLLKRLRAEGRRLESQSAHASSILTAPQLLALELPEPSPVIEGVISEGLTLLAGKPKLGKSILALNLAAAIATGRPALGGFATRPGPVLYLSLEDGPRRLKGRLAKVAPEAPEALELATDWPRVEEGCLATLGTYVSEHAPRCVLIDTLARVRPRDDRSRDKYQADYESLAGLQRLAIERGLAMIVIHHTRKADASDFLDAVSGTAGLTAAADSIAVLRRARSEAAAILEVTGRDVEERSFALQLDGEALTWMLLGDGEEYALSQERREILEHLRSLGGERAWPKAIAEALGKPEKIESIKHLCRKLAGGGQIQRDSRGYFVEA